MVGDQEDESVRDDEKEVEADALLVPGRVTLEEGEGDAEMDAEPPLV